MPNGLCICRRVGLAAEGGSGFAHLRYGGPEGNTTNEFRVPTGLIMDLSDRLIVGLGQGLLLTGVLHMSAYIHGPLTQANAGIID